VLVPEGEAPGFHPHPPGAVEDGDQHEEAPDEREEHELDRGVDPAGPTPHPDEEVHRDEHEFPEDVEEKEIGRQEGPQHPDLEDEEEGEEFLHPPRDVAPRSQDDDGHEERGEEHEKEAHAVDAQAVVDSPLWNPRGSLDELEIGLARLEAFEHGEREAERHERKDERRAAEPGDRLSRQERQDDGPGEWREDDEGEEGEAHHRST